MAVNAQKPQRPTSTDRIEKRVVLRAPRARVWRALTSAEEFGTWFRAKLDGEFAVGRTTRARVQSAGHDMILEMLVERIEPEHYLSYRWHPYPNDPKADYSPEPTTLVEFHLEEHADGTALTIVESGFDGIPVSRRAEAFRMHTQGWDEEAQYLARYVSA